MEIGMLRILEQVCLDLIKNSLEKFLFAIQ